MTEVIQVSVIIPSRDEEGNIAHVIEALKSVRSESAAINEIIVVDNGSTDRTADVAKSAGAKVCAEPVPGYGSACLRGLSAIDPASEIVLFIDGDFSDLPQEWPRLVEPIAEGEFDLVIGSRVLGDAERGALLPQARFGNWLATRLIRMIYGFEYSDLGPFRAIRAEKLKELKMEDRNFGWTVEMQLKALRHELRIAEVPVAYRVRRSGASKVTGSVKGSILAGHKIILLIAREYLRRAVKTAAV